MDEHTLADEFAAAVHGEPPLGFDPDDVVTSAARQQRRRRATLLAGGGVAAVALAAVCVPLVLSGSSRATTADLSTAPQQVSHQLLSHQDLVDRQTQAAQHLFTILPKVVSEPTVTDHGDGFVGLFSSPTASGAAASATLQGFGEDAGLVFDGHQSDLELMVRIPADSTPPVPVDQQCAVVRQEDDGFGDQVTCTLTRLPDGGTLMVSHVVWADKVGFPKPANGQHEQDRTVTDFRPDGTEVDVTSAISEGADSQHVLLSTAALTTLATDPAFRLVGG